MNTYFLSVLKPIPEPAGGHVVTILRVEVDQGIGWVREHADEIATRSQGPGYSALMLRAELPPDEIAATLPRPRSLFCACCGGWTKGRQWPNQDTGYGLCVSCVEWKEKRGTDAEEIRRNYGIRGVHFDIPA